MLKKTWLVPYLSNSKKIIQEHWYFFILWYQEKREMQTQTKAVPSVKQKNIRIFTPSSHYVNPQVFNLSVLKTLDHIRDFRSVMKNFKVTMVIILILHSHFPVQCSVCSDWTIFFTRWHTTTNVTRFPTILLNILLPNARSVHNMCTKFAYVEKLVLVSLKSLNSCFGTNSVSEFFKKFLHWLIH